MRPRLILSLEQQIQKNIDDPTFVYEALKVYLMLGGKAPQVDNDLILNWFTRDWEDRTFPGAPNAEGRALLRKHLEAMLDMDDGQARKVSLNGPLVEQAQATLARMRVADRAYTLLKSEAHNAAVEDWIALQRGGPDMALVFEAANGANLDTVRVPGFFTYEGFYNGLLANMHDHPRQAAEGQLGARSVRRPERRQQQLPVSIPAFSSSTAGISSPPGPRRSTTSN